MTRSRLIVGRRAGLTFLEVIISTAIFSIVIAATATLFQGAGATSSLVHNKTTVQLEAQRVMSLVNDQLKATMVSGNGNFVLDTTTVTDPVLWTMTFNKLSPNADIFDHTAADPVAAMAATIWSGPFVLRCVRGESGAASNGVDDDGDYIVDEQRLELVDGTNVIVLGDDLFVDISALETTQARPRIRFTLTVDRLIYGAVKNSADAAAASQGNGPRVKYIADQWITFPG